MFESDAKCCGNCEVVSRYGSNFNASGNDSGVDHTRSAADGQELFERCQQTIRARPLSCVGAGLLHLGWAGMERSLVKRVANCKTQKWILQALSNSSEIVR